MVGWQILEGCLIVEGVESKPLSVNLSVDRIQLCVLPFPKRATLTGLFGLAPMRIFVSAIIEQPRLFRFIVHTQYCSFLIHCQPFLTPLWSSCTMERGLSSGSSPVSGPSTPSNFEVKSYFSTFSII